MNREILRIRAEKTAAIFFAVVIGAVTMKSCSPFNGDNEANCTVEITRPGTFVACPISNLVDLGKGAEDILSNASDDFAAETEQ